MQFIANGPEIPNALLQAHEEGRVVFFCGAGISYPADLPGFKELVEQIYDLTGTVLTESERYAFDSGQYDATLDLLERRLPGQRLAVRRALAQALKPKLCRKGATDTPRPSWNSIPSCSISSSFSFSRSVLGASCQS
ncbi:hypothetical protein [Thiolapillus sp.]|uniref:hypothetical protein n=1 Tax=Thiolapillus sp. TaxID=2017437 RepID=UPI003AF6A864